MSADEIKTVYARGMQCSNDTLEDLNTKHPTGYRLNGITIGISNLVLKHKFMCGSGETFMVFKMTITLCVLTFSLCTLYCM